MPCEIRKLAPIDTSKDKKQDRKPNPTKMRIRRPNKNKPPPAAVEAGEEAPVPAAVEVAPAPAAVEGGGGAGINQLAGCGRHGGEVQVDLVQMDVHMQRPRSAKRARPTLASQTVPSPSLD